MEVYNHSLYWPYDVHKENGILGVKFEVLMHVMMDNNKLLKGTEKSDYSLLEYRAMLFGINSLEPCFSIYFSSRNPKTYSTRHITSNIKLNTNIFIFYLHYM